MPCKKYFLYISVLLSLFGGVINAQYTTRITHESILVLPPDYDPSVSYPVVVMMPFTGGDAEYMFDAYAAEAGSEAETHSGKLADILTVFNAQRPDAPRSFAVILPRGKGSRRDHSWRGFEQCFKRYEERVIVDLKKFSANYNLDMGRVYLMGVSLGGDLSWALSLRNPEYFQGAMVMGSRCSYVPPDGALPLMHQKNYAFFMTMGMKEANDRLAGIRYARKQLDSMQILNIYKEMPDLYHHKAPLWLFMEGMDYLLSAKEKVREEKSIESDWGSKAIGIYTGDLEVNYFDRNMENEEITLTGDGLFLPYETEFLPGVGLEITRSGAAKVSIRLMHNDFPAIEGYVSEKTADRMESLEFTVYEQEIRGYKYRGTSAGDEDSKVHGVINLQKNDKYLTISFDVYQSSKPEKYVTYTYFARIEE
jgi:pimeloyl-ACP methyl ester carboxylesterase